MAFKASNSSALTARFVWLVACAASLCACGIGQSSGTSAAAGAAADTTSTAMQFDVPGATDTLSLAAQPTFHVAPVLLDEPDDMDAVANDTSAFFGPHVTRVPASLSRLSTRRLTREAIEAAARGLPSMKSQAETDDPDATPLAAGTAVATYSPAQIRAAYGLPALPQIGTALTATQAAQLGAGQTVYIVDAMNNPNVGAELNAFDQKFGLPSCTLTPVAANATMPLAPASMGGCVLSVVYTTPSGAISASAPAYDSGWSTEISLDVQWVHATAPLARIILLEAPDSSVNSLIAAVNVANSMGQGVVSMSFGSTEGGWTAGFDSSFAVANMSYVASTGDSGAAVNWPAVSSRVLAVGGTSLTYNNSARSEVVWSSTGGGVSRYTSRPAYQAVSVPGLGTPTGRSVADVSFNADPTTGQFIAVISPGSTSVGWLSAGGTSLSAPQWAGLLSIANAMRVSSAQAALGAPHAALYGTIAAVSSNYASAFSDITQGSDGSCATCGAKSGYDTPTGLGTPNVSSLLPLLTAPQTTASAPTVSSASVTGTTGVSLSFTVAATAPDSLSFSLGGAPSGMTINSTGVVTWSAPVAGTYGVTVTASDTVTKLTGKGVYAVTITAPAPPAVTAASIVGTAGVAITQQITITASDAVTLTLSGAPSGVALGSTGVLSWPNPVQGSYSATVTAKDTKTAASGQGAIKITIGAAQAPAVGSASISGTTGAALMFAVSVTSANPVNYSLKGSPTGMTISSAGAVTWPKPIAGNYSVTISATDPKTNLSGQGVYKITISAPGPAITVAPISGTHGRPVSGVITIADTGATSLAVTIAGVPAGMTFAQNGLTLTANWPSPVTGTYRLSITVTDSSHLSANAILPVMIQ